MKSGEDARADLDREVETYRDERRDHTARAGRNKRPRESARIKERVTCPAALTGEQDHGRAREALRFARERLESEVILPSLSIDAEKARAVRRLHDAVSDDDDNLVLSRFVQQISGARGRIAYLPARAKEFMSIDISLAREQASVSALCADDTLDALQRRCSVTAERRVA